MAQRLRVAGATLASAPEAPAAGTNTGLTAAGAGLSAGKKYATVS